MSESEKELEDSKTTGMTGITSNDDGMRYLRLRKPGDNSEEPKLKVKMETRLKTLLKEFRSGHKHDFAFTRFACHWAESVEHHINYIVKHTSSTKIENVVKHLWRGFVEEIESKQDHLLALSINNDNNGMQYQYSDGITTAKPLDSLPVSELWSKDSTGKYLIKANGGEKMLYTSIFKSWIHQSESRRKGLKVPQQKSPIKSVKFICDKSYFNSIEYCSIKPYSVSKLAQEPSFVDIEITLKDNYFPKKFKFRHRISFKATKTASFVKLTTTETIVRRRRKSLKNLIANKIFKGPLKTIERTIFLKVGNDYALIEEVKDTNVLNSIHQKFSRKAESIQESAKKGETIVRSALIMRKFMQNKTNTDKYLALGAIMSTILHDFKPESQLDPATFKECYTKGKQRLRYIILTEEVVKGGFRYFMHNGLKNRLNKDRTPLELSELASTSDDYEIDYFVSHCWSDDISTKIDLLISFSKTFYEEHKRYPKLWIDLFCVDQDIDELLINIKLLPVFLMSCNKILLLQSNTLTTRLWCLMEIYSRAVMSRNNKRTGDKIEIIEVESINRESKNIDCNNAHCAFEQDSLVLRDKLNKCPGGITRVNKVIQEALNTAKIIELPQIKSGS